MLAAFAFCFAAPSSGSAAGGVLRLPATRSRNNSHTHEKDPALIIVSISSNHLLDLIRSPADAEPNFLNRPTHGLPLHVYYDLTFPASALG